jgi:hypothetical protein
MSKPPAKRGLAKARRKADCPEATARQRMAFEQALERHNSFVEPATVRCFGGKVSSPHSDEEGFTTMLSAALGSRSPEWELVALNQLMNAAQGRGQVPGPELESAS